jgi:hypothetical protein
LKHPQWQKAATEIGNKHKTGEADFEAFRHEALDAFEGVTRVSAEDKGIGMSARNLGDYSLVRALSGAAHGKLTGLEKEVSDTVAKLTGRETQGFFIPQDVMTHKRALSSNVFSAAGALVETGFQGQSLIELLRNQMYTVAMGARTISGLKGNLSIPSQTGGATAMFVEEARVSAQLAHPNIVQVYDFGQEGPRYFLVMEWVDGLSLAHFVRLATDHGVRVPWPFVAMVGLEALRGLAAAHEKVDAFGRATPIFHRDVTPQNILLGLNGSAKLADFGLARATDRARMTAPDIVKGKVGYLAPELVQNPEPTAQSDLYALGIVMWQALSGRRLFEGKDDIEVFVAASRGEVGVRTDVVIGIAPAAGRGSWWCPWADCGR